MHKNAMKCNKTLSKWCKNKHGASKIIDMFETYQAPILPAGADEDEDRGRYYHWAQRYYRPPGFPATQGLEDGGRYYRPQAGSTAWGIVTAIIAPCL
jgi:hypothetical protein